MKLDLDQYKKGRKLVVDAGMDEAQFNLDLPSKLHDLQSAFTGFTTAHDGFVEARDTSWAATRTDQADTARGQAFGLVLKKLLKEVSAAKEAACV